MPLVVTTAVKLPAVGRVEKLTVSAVDVAESTVPTAPLLNVTELLAAVVSNPAPLITILVALNAKLAVLCVTAGETFAICTAAPLDCELLVTTAVKLPIAVGRVENVTVRVVAVAEVTVPDAPLFKETLLLPAVVSNPKPLIVTVFALIPRAAALLVTTGMAVATCTAEPLLILFDVTTAVRLPAAGFVVRETVSEVFVAAVTVPIARPLKLTVLLAAVLENPNPLIVTVAAFAFNVAELLVITGVTVATDTAVPLLAPFVVTMAVKLPASGLVLKVTVSAVAVAEVTVPTAMPLNTTVLFAAVVLNPSPLITTVFEFAAKDAVLLVTTGFTVATCTPAPLDCPPVVTTAVRLPTAAGFTEKVTVSEVAVAEVTVPEAPLLNVTEFCAAVREKPNPLITTVFALKLIPVVLLVTTGITVATCTALPLATLLVVTTAVKLPTDVGRVEKLTVILVVVAEVTAPTAPPLKETVLFAAMGSKPNPLMVSEAALASKLLELLVTTGFTVAT